MQRLVLASLCASLPLAACAREHAVEPTPDAAPGEAWFRRAPGRSAPPEEPPPVPVKKELPPGAKDGPPRLPGSIPGPSALTQWKVTAWVPGASSDTIKLPPRASGFTLSDTLVQASARTALIGYQGDGPFDGTRITNCLFLVEEGTVPEGRSFWGLRGYDMRNTTLERVEITGFGRPTERHDEGHGIYFNLVGALTLTDCHIHHNGGQGAQLVNRPNESTLPRGPAAGAITVRRTWFHENGFNPDRGGFQLSIFGTGQDVVLSDVEIVAGRDATPFPGGRTGGGLLIEPQGPSETADTCWWSRGGQAQGAAELPFTQGKVVLEDLLIDQKDADRAIAQIKGCRELVVRRSEFTAGEINLDDPTKAGRSSGRIEWSGNRGEAVVFLAGALIGPASQDFVALDGVVQ
jgi:hypothetical protein